MRTERKGTGLATLLALGMVLAAPAALAGDTPTSQNQAQVAALSQPEAATTEQTNAAEPHRPSARERRLAFNARRHGSPSNDAIRNLLTPLSLTGF